MPFLGGNIVPRLFLSPIFQFCGIYLVKAPSQVVSSSVSAQLKYLSQFCDPVVYLGELSSFSTLFLFAIYPLIPLSASLSGVFWAILLQADNITLKNNLISTDPPLWVQLLQFCGSFMRHAMCNYLLSDLQLSPGWFINVINLIHLSLDWDMTISLHVQCIFISSLFIRAL